MRRVIVVLTNKGSRATCLELVKRFAQSTELEGHELKFVEVDEGVFWTGEIKSEDVVIPISITRISQKSTIPILQPDIIVACGNRNLAEAELSYSVGATEHMPCKCGTAQSIALAPDFDEYGSVARELLTMLLKMGPAPERSAVVAKDGFTKTR